MNQGWRFCRFNGVVNRVVSCWSLVSPAPPFYLVLGPYWTTAAGDCCHVILPLRPSARRSEEVSSPSIHSPVPRSHWWRPTEVLTAAAAQGGNHLAFGSQIRASDELLTSRVCTILLFHRRRRGPPMESRVLVRIGETHKHWFSPCAAKELKPCRQAAVGETHRHGDRWEPR